MGGASDYLWYEFKEVELLNEVTKMRYLDVHAPDVLHCGFRWFQIIPQSRYRATLFFLLFRTHPAIRLIHPA
jgi:hypothetical protein